MALHANVTHDLGDLRAGGGKEEVRRASRGADEDAAIGRTDGAASGCGWGRDGVGGGTGHGGRPRFGAGDAFASARTYPARVISRADGAVGAVERPRAPAAAAVRGEEHGIGRAHPDALVPAGAEGERRAGRLVLVARDGETHRALDRLRHRPSRVSRVRARDAVSGRGRARGASASSGEATSSTRVFWIVARVGPCATRARARLDLGRRDLGVVT